MFLNICSTAITRLLGGQVDDRIVKGWNTAQPRDAASPIDLGRSHLDFDRRQTAERGRAVKKLVQLDPDFAVRLALMSADVNAVNSALKKGSKPENLVMSPAALFLEPATPAGLDGARKLLAQRVGAAGGTAGGRPPPATSRDGGCGGMLRRRPDQPPHRIGG